MEGERRRGEREIIVGVPTEEEVRREKEAKRKAKEKEKKKETVIPTTEVKEPKELPPEVEEVEKLYLEKRDKKEPPRGKPI